MLDRGHRPWPRHKPVQPVQVVPGESKIPRLLQNFFLEFWRPELTWRCPHSGSWFLTDVVGAVLRAVKAHSILLPFATHPTSALLATGATSEKQS